MRKVKKQAGNGWIRSFGGELLRKCLVNSIDLIDGESRDSIDAASGRASISPLRVFETSVLRKWRTLDP